MEESAAQALVVSAARGARAVELELEGVQRAPAVEEVEPEEVQGLAAVLEPEEAEVMAVEEVEAVAAGEVVARPTRAAQPRLKREIL